MRISDWSSDVCSSDLSASLIEKLVESWAETHPVDATLVNRETNINYVHVAGPDEQVVVQRFEVTLGRDDAWPIEFIYPLAALRGIEPLMGARVHDELKISDPAWRERLGRPVNHVRFPARSILDIGRASCRERVGQYV